jgi:protein gp37
MIQEYDTTWNPTDDPQAPPKWRKPKRIRLSADLFTPGVPDDAVDRAFAVMALCPHVAFQVVTERPGRMGEYMGQKTDDGIERTPREAHPHRSWPAFLDLLDALDGDDLRNSPSYWAKGWPLPNVCLGVSAEDQRQADERIPALLRCPAAVRFALLDPLRGPVNLRQVAGLGFDHWDVLRGSVAVYGNANPAYSHPTHYDRCGRIGWVVVAGGDEPLHPQWVRDIRDQCTAAGVPFFFRGWGWWVENGTNCGGKPGDEWGRLWPNGRWLAYPRNQSGVLMPAKEVEGSTCLVRVGPEKSGRLLDGKEHLEFPAFVGVTP